MITKFKIFENIRWWRNGKLSDEEEDNIPETISKNPIEIFKNFLKENGAYNNYIININNSKIYHFSEIGINDENFNTVIKKINNMLDWIDIPFTWDKTPEGQNFWSILNDKWFKICNKMMEH